MEVIAAGRGPPCERLDTISASVAFDALSQLSLKPQQVNFSIETARLACQRNAAEARGGCAAFSWERRLTCLCYRERLRMHATSLKNCFSLLQRELQILAASAADVYNTSGAAAHQLQQTLTHRKPVLHALQLLRDRRLLMQERQRLCGLLCERLRLSSPLLQVIAAGEPADKSSTRAEVCEQYFDALEELQQIRGHAHNLQRAVVPSDIASAGGGSSENYEAATTTLAAASAGSADFHSSLLRRRALAEVVSQQAEELQELAYERLYLWLQQECRIASAAAEAAPTRGERSQPDAMRVLDSGSRSVNSTSVVIATETAAKAAHSRAFFAALASSGVAAATCGFQYYSRAGKAATPAKTTEKKSFSFFSSESHERRLPAVTKSHRRTVAEGSEGLRNHDVETRAPATERTQAAPLQWAYQLRQPVPLLLRAFFTLQARPPYLSHCLQELLHVRQKDVAQQFYRLLFASSSGCYLGISDCSSSYSNGAAVRACGDIYKDCTFNADGGEGYYASVCGSSTRLAYLKRSQPLRFLQGLLRCVTAVAARERAVVAGLQQLLLPTRSETNPGAHSERAKAAVETPEAAVLAAAAAKEKPGDRQFPAETTGKPQLIPASGAVLRKPATSDDPFEEDAGGVLVKYDRPDNLETRDGGTAESSYGAVTLPPFRAGSQTAASKAAGGEIMDATSSAVETLCSTDMLEWLLSGVAEIFEQQLEDVFAAVRYQQQKQEAGGSADGEKRHQPRPSCTIYALAMAHLLDKHAILLRRLLLFNSDLIKKQQQERAAHTRVNDATHAIPDGATEPGPPMRPALATDDAQYPYKLSVPEASRVSKSQEFTSKCRDMDNRSLPRLITSCETYAEKAELLFLSLWEHLVVYAASSCGRVSSPGSVLPSFCTNDSAMIHCVSTDSPPHPTDCKFETARDPPLLKTNEGGKASDVEPVAPVKPGDCDLLLREVMNSLEQALEILFAPLCTSVEEAEASEALASFIWGALEESPDVAQRLDGEFSKSTTVKGRAKNRQQSASTSALLNEGLKQETAAGGTVATVVPRSLAEAVLHFFERDAAVCCRAPKRRSKITGLRIIERLRPLQENETQELDAWVESSVAPLLNFCRQETRRFSDVGDAAVFLVNAYSSIEAPLRRFAVCRRYAQLLEELIEHQMTLLHQVETEAIFSRLELNKTLEAVHREVRRRKLQETQDAAFGREGHEEEGLAGAPVGRNAVDGIIQFNAIRGPNSQWGEGGRALWDANDNVQVGGALSPAEPCLQKAALTRFFKKFSSILYTLESVELGYIRRIIQAKHRLEATKLVLKSVVAAYAEVYVCTRHLNLAVHTPGEVALLIAS